MKIYRYSTIASVFFKLLLLLVAQQLFNMYPCFCNFRSIHPIQFGISESKIVSEIPPKDRDFAFIIPGQTHTYIYDNEEEYYKDYQRSYYAITSKKGGWDCMRHYEILANGCIPYFIHLEDCDFKTMPFLPRELILEAMNLPGVSYLKIDHQFFDKNRYEELLQKLLIYTKKFLTTRSIAQYVLDIMNYSGHGKILFLSYDTYTDYMRCNLLVGLKELLGSSVVDVPKIPHIYSNYQGNIRNLYGKGISYTKIVEDDFVDRHNIIRRIKNKEFELIIYGSVHRGLLLHELVKNTYPSEKIAYVCGEDFHDCTYASLPNLFLREFEALYKSAPIKSNY